MSKSVIVNLISVNAKRTLRSEGGRSVVALNNRPWLPGMGAWNAFMSSRPDHMVVENDIAYFVCLRCEQRVTWQNRRDITIGAMVTIPFEVSLQREDMIGIKYRTLIAKKTGVGCKACYDSYEAEKQVVEAENRLNGTTYIAFMDMGEELKK